MTDFATDLLWEDAEKQQELLAPGHARTRASRRELGPAPRVPAESQAERLQRVAGNAALSLQAEASDDARSERAGRVVSTQAQEAQPPTAAARDQHLRIARGGESPARATLVEPRSARVPAAPESRSEAPDARVASEVSARASREALAAAARGLALAQVVAAFERNARKARLLALALLVERAPPGSAEQAARILARSVLRADHDQRAEIAAQIKAQLGDRRELKLSRLLADRLAGLVASSPARSAPAPAPPES